jgi:hypothetical protein
MTKKQIKLNSISEDIVFVENWKSESLTALSMYNHLCQLYMEEGDEGIEHLEKMWRVAKADMKNNSPF